MVNKKRCTAIVLAGGSGSRMKSSVAKQYMLLDGKPLIWYALNAMEKSTIIDDCILVTGKDDIAYAQKEIVEKYHFTKVDTITAGGTERYYSVLNALRVIANGDLKHPNEDGFVFIHDGARPFLTSEILKNAYEAVEHHHACVAAVPCKDTIKIADSQGFVADTPSRSLVWSIQTPQVFDTQLIINAYEDLAKNISQLQEQGITITDDASVVEIFTEYKVKLVEAEYTNIKITTPEDITTAEAFLKKKF